jgi:hypothetical protein
MKYIYLSKTGKCLTSGKSNNFRYYEIKNIIGGTIDQVKHELIWDLSDEVPKPMMVDLSCRVKFDREITVKEFDVFISYSEKLSTDVHLALSDYIDKFTTEITKDINMINQIKDKEENFTDYMIFRTRKTSSKCIKVIVRFIFGPVNLDIAKDVIWNIIKPIGVD